jgi:hypothetical protein
MSKLSPDILKLPLHVRAEMALKVAVRKALAEHASEGRPAYIWRDGRVVAMTPEEIRAYLAATESVKTRDDKEHGLE